ncbi:MAG: hypothetical protein CME62_18120 [Halobacteriovoraceae bacterium]|nr:hypothetical protein [Halobacteriovoraceae bacterium]|tara:strand:+ start:353 stop:1117 length:765 start_codon:yes stop_codon:yes gene_type:complete
MKHIITLSLCIYVFTGQQQLLAAEYQWIRSKNNYFSGDCYQIEKKDSQQIKLKVKIEKCRPQLTEYVFLKEKGNCYEIDSKTKGQTFTRRVSKKLCRSEDTIYLMGQFGKQKGCFEVDSETNGEKFYKKTSLENCKENTEETFFSYDEKIQEGKCFVKDQNDKFLEVKTHLCKTPNTETLFEKQNLIEGKCFIQDVRGAKYYRHETKIENCKPQKTDYIIISPPNKPSAQCFEVDTETNGEKFIQKVRNKFCEK